MSGPFANAEAARLGQARDRRGCPEYSGRSLVNLAVSAFRAAGGDPDGDPPMAPPLSGDLDPFGDRPAEGPVVVFLVDGFGWRHVEQWADDAGDPAAQLWRGLARPITTVFPSTTTAALTSLSTGAPPGRHGLVGYRQYLPRWGMVADMLRMSPVGVAAMDALIGPQWKPELLSGVPTLASRGVRTAALTRDRFQGSGFTRLLYDGAEFAGYATAADLAHGLLALLERDDPPGLIHVYWDELDTIQHLRGPRPELVGLELDRLARLVSFVGAHLADARARRTRLLVTGDHGQVPATPQGRIRLEQAEPVARELGRPPAGDRRAGLLAARRGRTAELKAALSALLPPGSELLDAQAALDAGLFGPAPFHPEILERIGDLVVLVPSPSSLTYLAPGAAEPTRHLFGAHGGLEPDELVVPLVTGALADFRMAGPAGAARRIT